MVTSPINPMRYWKLEEIQRILNQIEGYENVVIEFQCQQSDGWNKLNWDCKYGIKEQLVNGQYNWLLKHVFVVEAKTELDAHNLAWQEAAERLITDVWRTSIHSFRKQQRELNKPKTPTTLTEGDLKIIDEINEMNNKTNNTIQTKTTWTETKRWMAAVGILLLVFGLMGTLYKYNILLYTIFSLASIWVVGFLLVWVKDIVDDVLD